MNLQRKPADAGLTKENQGSITFSGTTSGGRNYT